MTTEYLSTGDIAKLIGVSQGTISNYNLPEPEVIVGGRYKGWLPETIEAWIAQRPGHGGRRPNEEKTNTP